MPEVAPGRRATGRRFATVAAIVQTRTLEACVRISVIGCGYLGAVHAACMAQIGHDVVGIDVDERKVAELSAGRAPFFEPGLPQLLEAMVGSGRLSFTTDVAAAQDATVHFIGVGTPQKRGEYAADLRYVDAAIEGLLPHLTPGDVVAGKSTVPVGTARRLADAVAQAQPEATLVWNPEFLREGHAVDDTLHPDRLVYGLPAGESGERAGAVLDEVYAPLIAEGIPKVVADYATAELVKVAANSFLATKISFINAMAELCEATGADVTLLADAIGFDERIGRKFLNAGLGFGGGCLPKDIRAFMARAGELGADQALSFLREVDSINMRRRVRMVDLAREVCGGSISGRRVAVLGAAFKPESDDIRDSPALNVANQMHLQGAQVVVTDPQAVENARRAWPDLKFAANAEEAAVGADVVVLLTEWGEYRRLDPETFGKVVAHRRMVDGRNVLDPVAWRSAGWSYRALGRP
jgi:UDPglucose 6-dehydrogenase